MKIVTQTFLSVRKKIETVLTLHNKCIKTLLVTNLQHKKTEYRNIERRNLINYLKSLR